MTAADELYGLPPEDFTPRRNALVKQAKADGDKDRAEAIGALRKPSTAAWALNVTARDDPNAFDRLLAIGASLRDAQRDLEAGDLRRLMHERHGIVAATLERVRAAAGRPLSAAVIGEIDAALRAAIADVGFAERIRSGVLVSTAADEPDLPVVDVRAKPAKRAAPAPKVSKPSKSNKALERATAALRDAEARLAELAAQRTGLEAQAEDVANRLRRLETDERRAEKALDVARQTQRRLVGDDPALME